MSPVGLGDVSALARAVMGMPAPGRAARLARMLRQARQAAAYRRRTGCDHPRWGTGCLMSLARRHPLPPEPFVDDPAYREALIAVLCALRDARPEGRQSQPSTDGPTAGRFPGIASAPSGQ